MGDDDVLGAVLGALPLPSLAIDDAGRIIAANAGALALVGPKMVGRSYVTMLRQPALLDAVEATLRDGRPREAGYLGGEGDGETTYRASVRAARGAGRGGAGAVILALEDLAHVERAGRMRRDFVANLGHELRTPLTAIMGFIETLRGPARDDPAAAGRFLDIMRDEAERMNRLIGDLMSLGRVEGGGRARPAGTVALDDILDSTLRALRPLADEAGVALEREFGDGPVRVAADADQLRQVFTNLVENAIRHGGSGGRVTARLAACGRVAALRGPGARVQIVDYGPGIDPAHLPRITERFYRADDHRGRAAGGAGLGLAIAKHIVSRHGGRLRAESAPGQGATFTVILPARDGPA